MIGVYLSQDTKSWSIMDTNITIPNWPQPFDGFTTSTDYFFLYIQVPNQGLYWLVRGWQQIKTVPADALIANFPVGMFSVVMAVRYQGYIVALVHVFY